MDAGATASITAAMDSANAAIGKCVAVRYSVSSAARELEADVFAIDTQKNCVVFRRAHAHTWQKADYFVLPASSITSLTVRSGRRRFSGGRQSHRRGCQTVTPSSPLRPVHAGPSPARPPQVLRDGSKTVTPAIGLNEIARRSDAAARIEQRQIEIRGVGVTDEAQRVFNGLLVQCVASWRGGAGARWAQS